ncbi:Organ specific protein [Dillenia turbinata]|uniref:Organ specific protein n=1 Tax=Dillenia turbinata TaxID=194707 RepID=A0AAN8VUR1_9MAGN
MYYKTKQIKNSWLCRFSRRKIASMWMKPFQLLKGLPVPTKRHEGLPMPEAIRGLMRSSSAQSFLDEKHKFQTSTETVNKVKSFRLKSGFWIYNKDNGLKEEKSFRKDLK